MSKKFLIGVIVLLAGFGGLMTYIAHGQGVLIDRMLRCASSSSLMEA